MSDIIQKSIEQYFHELNVPDEKREKIVMAVTKMVYERNRTIVVWEKENDEHEKIKLAERINEKDRLIKEKIGNILAGKEEDGQYDF